MAKNCHAQPECKLVEVGDKIGYFKAPKYTKTNLALDPASGAHSTLPDPLAGWEGVRCPVAQKPHPLSALQLWPFRPCLREPERAPPPVKMEINSGLPQL